jgi:hypothetical protein
MKNIYFILLTTLILGCSKEIEKVVPPTTNNKGGIMILSVDLVEQVDTLSISNFYKPKVLATYSNGYKSDISDSVIINSNDTTVYKFNSKFYGAKSGKAFFEIKFSVKLTFGICDKIL